MSDFITQLDDALASLTAAGLRLRGNRVAVMVEPAKDTYGDSPIIKADTYKHLPLMGTVIAHGSKMSDKDRDEIPIGHMTTFNRSGAIADHLRVNGRTMEVYLISELDTLWVWPPDAGVVSCTE